MSPSAERTWAKAFLRHPVASGSVSGNKGKIRGDGVRASAERVSFGGFLETRTVVSAANTPSAGTVNLNRSGCWQGNAAEKLNGRSRVRQCLPHAARAIENRTYSGSLPSRIESRLRSPESGGLSHMIVPHSTIVPSSRVMGCRRTYAKSARLYSCWGSVG